MTRDEYLKEIDNVSSFDKEAVLKIVQIAKLYIKSLEEQTQGLQSLLDFKQQEISVLESKLGEVKTCDGCIWYDELHPSYCDCLEPCSRFKHGWDKDRYEPKQN